MFHNTTPDLQDQDQDRFFWSQTGLVLRPTVSDHITDKHEYKNSKIILVLYLLTRCATGRRWYMVDLRS